jgi:hypothetical protein
MSSIKNTGLRLARFNFSEVVVIESLGSQVSTGKVLADYISTLDSFVELGIPISFINCQNANDLRRVFTTLTQNATVKDICPLLHIECHGRTDGGGLVLANGNSILWTELSPMLKALNIATNFNLLVFFAACNAFYFIEEMKAMKPSPVYALVAPSDELDPGEIMRGTRVYYRELFESGDAGFALQKLRAEQLSTGRWFGKTAEEWFEEVIVNYVDSNCSKGQMAERARALYQSQSSLNKKSVGKLKRELKQYHAHPGTFVEKYFHECFCLKELPDNLLRFDNLKTRVEAKMKSLLASPAFR